MYRGQEDIVCNLYQQRNGQENWCNVMEMHDFVLIVQATYFPKYLYLQGSQGKRASSSITQVDHRRIGTGEDYFRQLITEKCICTCTFPQHAEIDLFCPLVSRHMSELYVH